MHPIVFYLLAIPTVITALLVVTRKNPISCAIWLIACFFLFAALFVTLEAHFIAVIQVLLYAGAIMVLFIFVIMLLNLRTEEIKPRMLQFSGLLGGAATLYLVLLFGLKLLSQPENSFSTVPQDFGYVAAVGRILFTKYLVPFELTSVLLLVAIIGSVVMGKKKI